MHYKSFLIFSIVTVLAVFDTARAKVIYYGSETKNLTVVYGETTLLKFDDQVKTISQASKFYIGPADTNDPNYQLLSIKPRFRRGKDHVSFILANDRVVSLNVNTITKATPEQNDQFIEFRSKEHQFDPNGKAAVGSNVSEIELMKAMVRGDSIVGYKTHNTSRKVNTGVDNVEAKLVRIYTGPKFHGYVFQIENRSKKEAFAIDLKSLTFGRPNVALLSQSDQKILEVRVDDSTKNKTFLRVVTQPTSVYYNINLPVAPIKVVK